MGPGDKPRDDSCRGIDVVCSRRRLHCLPRTRLCRQQVQLEGEDGAAVRVVRGAQHSVEVLHDVVGYREAEAEPFTDSLGGEEGIEDAVERIGRDAGAVVAQAEDHAPLRSAHGELEPWRGLRLPQLFLRGVERSEEHTSEPQSLMRISYAVFCLKKKRPTTEQHTRTSQIM